MHRLCVVDVDDAFACSAVALAEVKTAALAEQAEVLSLEGPLCVRDDASVSLAIGM
ncbi:hypothetical protein D3C87_1751490 [compost metagenome]